MMTMIVMICSADPLSIHDFHAGKYLESYEFNNRYQFIVISPAGFLSFKFPKFVCAGDQHLDIFLAA